MSERYLLVGYPGLVARAVLRVLDAEVAGSKRAGSERAGPEVEVLVETPVQAERLATEWPFARARLGRWDAVDLGLSGPEYMDLAGRSQRLIWCAELSGGEGYTLEDCPALRSAAELVELARVAGRLEAAVYLSSVLALGDARGRVLESELRVGQRFQQTAEEACAIGEGLVERASKDLPLTIARAPAILGDGETGECPVDGALLRLVRGCEVAPRVIPASFRDQPVHAVTADFVARSLLALVREPRARGRRVHLVEEQPPTDLTFFECVATGCERTLEERPLQGLFARPQSPLMRLKGVDARLLQGWDIVFDRTEARGLLPEPPEPLKRSLPRLIAWCRGLHD